MDKWTHRNVEAGEDLYSYIDKYGRPHEMWKCPTCSEMIVYSLADQHMRRHQFAEYRGRMAGKAAEMDPFASADWEDY